jgi:hypothetical protein
MTYDIFNSETKYEGVNPCSEFKKVELNSKNLKVNIIQFIVLFYTGF